MTEKGDLLALFSNIIGSEFIMLMAVLLDFRATNFVLSLWYTIF